MSSVKMIAAGLLGYISVDDINAGSALFERLATYQDSFYELMGLSMYDPTPFAPYLYLEQEPKDFIVVEPTTGSVTIQFREFAGQSKEMNVEQIFALLNKAIPNYEQLSGKTFPPVMVLYENELFPLEMDTILQ